jgi:fatty acid desaturase
MHDASHYGTFENWKLNSLASEMWNNFGLWNAKIWFYHHVYAHHTFTGDESKDPDVLHYRPFARKY